MIGHLLSITIAIILDNIIGDPKDWPHPVRLMGKVIAFLDSKWNQGRYRKAKGLCMLMVILLLTFIFSYSLVLLAYHIHWWIGVLLEAVLIFTTIAQKSLRDAALEVYEPLIKKDLPTARKNVSYIVGRDTEHLDEAEIVRATVETVAENTSDGITAPLFWAFIGGAPLSMVYRAINTCDSMVGYKNDQYHKFGYFSARLDDVVNYLPSRITAFLLLLFSKTTFYSKKEAWRRLICDAKKHPSPNSGWGEAVTAIILGIQLGGINYYKGSISDRARMGEAFEGIHVQHIILSNELARKSTLLFYTLFMIGGIGIEMAISWS